MSTFEPHPYVTEVPVISITFSRRLLYLSTTYCLMTRPHWRRRRRRQKSLSPSSFDAMLHCGRVPWHVKVCNIFTSFYQCAASGSSTLEHAGGATVQLHPSFWHDVSKIVTMTKYYFLCRSERLRIRNRLALAVTRAYRRARWNFHVWKFHKLMDRPNRDGQSKKPQGLWSIAPQIWAVRTATVCSFN